MQLIYPKAKKWRRALTLVETLVAVGISSIAFAALAAFAFYSGRSFAAIGNYVDLDNTSRKAVDLMTKEIRQAKSLTGYQTNALTFTDYDDKQLQYIYDPAGQTLTRVKDTIPTVLLTGCDSLEFHIYDGAPNPGTNNFNLTTDAARCKLIDMKWRCSRLLLGQKANTETVQTAQVVIRN
jgi:hypothetical protein